jgi:hypothetical protein
MITFFNLGALDRFAVSPEERYHREKKEWFFHGSSWYMRDADVTMGRVELNMDVYLSADFTRTREG